MQVFVPFPDIQKSVESLDPKRLGKQRVETWQILNAIGYLERGDLINPSTGRKRGWLTHPATLAWRNNVDFLNLYGEACCIEWARRGYVDNMRERFSYAPNPSPPAWWGNAEIHQSHRCRLLQKDFGYYFHFIFETKLPLDFSTIDYVWPTTQEM